MSKRNQPRGVRNNNPLNIRIGNNWRGEALVSKDAEFETFSHPKYGFRAGAKLLRNYQRRYGLNTVERIIHRFAPPNENHTDNYVNFVARNLGVSPTQSIDLSSDTFLSQMLHAMSVMEVGRYYTVQDAAEGVALA